jgi:hypothetical protein
VEERGGEVVRGERHRPIYTPERADERVGDAGEAGARRRVRLEHDVGNILLGGIGRGILVVVDDVHDLAVVEIGRKDNLRILRRSGLVDRSAVIVWIPRGHLE